ncbi:unnamed protein product [Calypogeia fissa]
MDQTKFLYVRLQFCEQMNFLDDVLHGQKQECKNPYPVGWITGPPGTCKSSSTLAYALTIDQNIWAVTWISCGRWYAPQFVQFIGNVQRTSCPMENIVKWIHVILNDVDKKYKHVVFLDGIRFGDQCHERTLNACHVWLLHNFQERRLVVISSMSARTTNSSTEEKLFGLKNLFVDSWILKDYLEAVRNADFFSSVKEKLNSSLDRAVTPAQLVKSKFHYAGGNCRLMFDYTKEDVVHLLNEALTRCDDVLKYLKGQIGDSVIVYLFSFVVSQLCKQGSR